MKKIILLNMTLVFAGFYGAAQTYHEDDKEGLRAFLRQPSAIDGLINAHVLWVDTLTWYDNETWAGRIRRVYWNDDIPKRVEGINWTYQLEETEPASVTDLAGHLDAGKWGELTMLRFGSNRITSVDVDNNVKLWELDCSSNELSALDVSNNVKLWDLDCADNELSALDVSNCTELMYLQCQDNQLTSLVLDTGLEFLDCSYNRLFLNYLFYASEIMGEKGKRYFGTQNLPPQNVGAGVPLFTEQSVFNGIFTTYSVTRHGVPIPESHYTVRNGAIAFHETGIYTVTMANDAIVATWSPTKAIVNLMVGEVGMVENREEGIDVFPNPTTGWVRIEHGESPVKHVEVFDMLGRNLHLPASPSDSPSSIDVSHLPAGVYLLKISTEAGVVIKKISKL